MSNIVFFKGLSRYNVLSTYVEQDAATLANRGHSVRILSIEPGLPNDAMKTLIEADLVVGYVGWGLELTTRDGLPVLPRIKAPFVASLGDHPVYLQNRLKNAAPHHHLVMYSSHNVAFAKNHLKIEAPLHMGMITYNSPPEFSLSNKDIDILVAGSVQNSEEILANRLAPIAKYIPLIRDLYVHWRDKSNCKEDVFVLFLNVFGKKLIEDLKELNRILSAACVFDVYCRNRYRIEMAEKLKSFSLTFVGSGWEEACSHFEHNFTFLPDVDYRSYLKTLQRAKVAINLLPPSFDFHERIVDSAANGAALVTHRTEWVSKAYSFEEEVVPLSLINEDVADGLNEYLSKPKRLEQIAEAGSKRVQACFTQEARANSYEQLMSTGKLGWAFAQPLGNDGAAIAS
ncbi:glycosyltransferase family protein [Roseibium sp.]|uniref:glycosyltransferase family protein n=1 Tax=Roseibium sp. TaxID=1936156 RepID=UPI003B507941